MLAGVGEADAEERVDGGGGFTMETSNGKEETCTRTALLLPEGSTLV